MAATEGSELRQRRRGGAWSTLLAYPGAPVTDQAIRKWAREKGLALPRPDLDVAGRAYMIASSAAVLCQSQYIIEAAAKVERMRTNGENWWAKKTSLKG